jgi:hypothetical protein
MKIAPLYRRIDLMLERRRHFYALHRSLFTQRTGPTCLQNFIPSLIRFPSGIFANAFWQLSRMEKLDVRI